MSLPDSPHVIARPTYCHCPPHLLSLPDWFGQSSNNAFITTLLPLVIFLDHPDKPGDDDYWRRVMTTIGAG
jgi:hypothetical protein